MNSASFLNRHRRARVRFTPKAGDPWMPVTSTGMTEESFDRLTGIIPTGGLAGTDTLGAAATVGLESVSYRGSGRPVWWSLDDDAPKQTLFKGTAREACRRFPKNANVAAAVSLMGIGFDATTVELVADPDLRIYRHEIFASGRFGNLHTRVDAEPIEAGKRSTHLIAGSLINSAQSAH